jgi:hypothetical protein
MEPEAVGCIGNDALMTVSQIKVVYQFEAAMKIEAAVKGHDFSRAENAAKSGRASAPEGRFYPN